MPGASLLRCFGLFIFLRSNRLFISVELEVDMTNETTNVQSGDFTERYAFDYKMAQQMANHARLIPLDERQNYRTSTSKYLPVWKYPNNA